MDGIKLTRKDSSIDFEASDQICIICNQSDNSVISTENWRETIRADAKVRNDIVTKRLSSLNEEAVFNYHIMNNECYKQYCHEKSLMKYQREKDLLENEDNDSISQSTKTLEENMLVTAVLEELVLRVETVHVLYVIRNHISAFTKNHVFTSTCDLEDESRVFGAEIFCHDNCISGYLLRYKRKPEEGNKSTPQASGRVAAFSRIANDIKAGIDEGYGYTLSYIPEKFNSGNEAMRVSNKELGLMLCDYFGNEITFAKPKAIFSLE
ncbi:unnamed protein product [Ceutorhynchus assimilis]|uniref:Uncharacterized protein n=1 Tax=Ceutorhynchus assimilis TaxID=467358 RepID=A0A9N9QE42_9CUCU|nr:unnamed protein product [Ceutorhynchus assimilis]